MPQRVERLRAAAATVSEAAPVLAETAGAVDLPSRRVWAPVLMTAVLGAGFGICHECVVDGAPAATDETALTLLGAGRHLTHLPDARAAGDRQHLASVAMLNPHPVDLG